MAETGSQSQFFFWQHREYHSWESTEENDTTHGGSWGVHGDPRRLMDYTGMFHLIEDTSSLRGPDRPHKKHTIGAQSLRVEIGLNRGPVSLTMAADRGQPHRRGRTNRLNRALPHSKCCLRSQSRWPVTSWSWIIRTRAHISKSPNRQCLEFCRENGWVLPFLSNLRR